MAKSLENYMAVVDKTTGVIKGFKSTFDGYTITSGDQFDYLLERWRQEPGEIESESGLKLHDWVPVFNQAGQLAEFISKSTMAVLTSGSEFEDLFRQWVQSGMPRLPTNVEEVLPVIGGLGPDAPIVENEQGGKQSFVPYRFDKLDFGAMFQLAAVLHSGVERYGEDENWRKITKEGHLNHALTHIFAELNGDTQDDHLSHAFCRLMFAIGVSNDAR